MKKKVYNLVIVDESGSMDIIRKQAFSGMNETLATVRTMQQNHPDTEQRVTLVTFDSGHTTWHLDNVPAAEARDLRWDEYVPSACTPLYDAVGRAVTKLESQVGYAAKRDNVLVTIITDGEENASSEWHHAMVQNLIERLKQRGWTFALIGTDSLDVRSMAHSMNIDEHLSFRQDDRGARDMFYKLRCACEHYTSSVSSDTAIPTGKLFDDEMESL